MASQAGEVDCVPSSGFNQCKRITYSGADQTFTVPNGVTSLDVRLWGAAGGGANSSYYLNQGGGGGGGFAKGTISVTGGQVLGIVIGQGGVPNSIANTYGGGGAGGNSVNVSSRGGSGGGASAVFSSAPIILANALIAAGGGGGASPGADSLNPSAGGGGGNVAGQDAVPSASGRAGTQSAGGAAATLNSLCSPLPTAGTLGSGGNGGGSTTASVEGGGGGGGGYWGGGGGMCQTPSNNQNGAGGGGSGYTAGSVTGASMANGANFAYSGGSCSGTSNSGGASDPLYSAGTGQGSCYGTGGNGEAVIQYNAGSITITMVSHGTVGSYTLNGTNGWGSQSITTLTPGVGVAGVKKELSTPSISTTITLTIPANHSMANAACNGMNGGTMTPNYTTGAMVFNATATAAANSIQCTVNLYKTPTFSLQKVSIGGVGSFSISGSTNLASNPATLTTTTEGVAAPTTAAAINVTVIGTAVSVTENIPSDYAVTGFACTDANSAITGNSGTFGTFATGVATIPAVNVKAGSVFSCLLTNTRARIRFQKVSLGGTATFSFSSASNLQATPGSMTTTVAGVASPALPVPVNINSIASQVSVTEAAVAGYRLTAVNCTDVNSAVTGNTGAFGSFTGNVVTIAASNVKAGSDINCIVTNARTPIFKLQVTSEAGSGGPVTFSQTNLVTTPPSISPPAHEHAEPGNSCSDRSGGDSNAGYCQSGDRVSI